jgi:hypothetical protein
VRGLTNPRCTGSAVRRQRRSPVTFYASYAEMETNGRRVAANPPAWFKDIHPLLKNGDTWETWEIVE